MPRGTAPPSEIGRAARRGRATVSGGARWRGRAPPGGAALAGPAPTRSRPTRQGSRAAPYLKLIDSATHRPIEIRDDVARLGRSPDCTVVLTGGAAGVVSGVHAEVRHARGAGGWTGPAH